VRVMTGMTIMNSMLGMPGWPRITGMTEMPGNLGMHIMLGMHGMYEMPGMLKGLECVEYGDGCRTWHS